MLDRFLGPQLPSTAHGVPLVSRICRSYTAPSSGAHHALSFEKEELVYELSAPKHGWILVKKTDPASSVVVWMPQDYLAEQQTGLYRAKFALTGRDGRFIQKGEILQITHVNRSGLWAYKKLDSIGRKGVIHPDDLEKAEIETEPPPRRRLSILAVSEASGSVRGQIKKFFTWKGKVLIKSADAPPPYQDF